MQRTTGLEFWIDGSIEVPKESRSTGLVERVLLEAGDLEAVGVQVEPKGPGVAFHYRMARDTEAARSAILRAIESPMTSRNLGVGREEGVRVAAEDWRRARERPRRPRRALRQ